MPTYQYSCTECGHFFETFQNFSDDSLTTCPECGGRLRKVFNAVGVVFKGSGFYRNDSRKADTESAPSTNGSEKGSESKPKKAGEATPATTKSDSSSGKSESSSGSSSGSPSTPAATS